MKTLRAVFCADRQNDLIRALRESGYEARVVQDAGEAVSLAGEGEAVFLAGGRVSGQRNGIDAGAA